jgi:hypothetical protein
MGLSFGMQKPVKSIKEVKIVDRLEDGVYDGKQSGYSLKFSIGESQYEAETTSGVRGIDCDCKVDVKAGEVVRISMD